MRDPPRLYVLGGRLGGRPNLTAPLPTPKPHESRVRRRDQLPDTGRGNHHGKIVPECKCSPSSLDVTSAATVSVTHSRVTAPFKLTSQEIAAPAFRRAQRRIPVRVVVWRPAACAGRGTRGSQSPTQINDAFSKR